MRRYSGLTPARRAALRKAQLASAAKRRKAGRAVSKYSKSGGRTAVKYSKSGARATARTTRKAVGYTKSSVAARRAASAAKYGPRKGPRTRAQALARNKRNARIYKTARAASYVAAGAYAAHSFGVATKPKSKYKARSPHQSKYNAALRKQQSQRIKVATKRPVKRTSRKRRHLKVVR